MSLKSIVKELRGIVATREETRRRGRSHIAPEGGGGLLPRPPPEEEDEGGSAWAGLPPELLQNIIQRVEAAESTWPGRRDVVACASVCKTWRVITKDVVYTPEQCGRLTFPISLKQPGPRDAPVQCFIRRDRATSTYLLYLGLSPSLSGDASKLLLAAKKIRRATGMDFRISLAGADFCQTSNSYVGKLRSNFLGTKFTIYDSQFPPYSAARSLRRSNGKKSSVDASACLLARHCDVATVSYELNIFRTRGPRRMLCAMHSIPLSSIRGGGSAPTPTEFRSCPDGQSNSSTISKTKQTQVALSSTSLTGSPESVSHGKEHLILRNKSPRWHEQLQCWCLNFKGRVTVASVKNFQLVAAVDSTQNVPLEEQEKVILQFGKIGKDIFTMDYRYPLSAFQAFAVCLSSFDTKPACE